MSLANLSKTISHALRHEPEIYGLKLDGEGWVNISDLINALRHRGWENIKETDIVLMIEKSPKKRHQVLDGKIRAFAGHSSSNAVIKTPSTPPAFLFHATSEEYLSRIFREGLLPMKRQYVHLSDDPYAAEHFAKNRRLNVRVLKINAQEASQAGIGFYKEANGVWLADSIPLSFILR